MFVPTIQTIKGRVVFFSQRARKNLHSYPLDHLDFCRRRFAAEKERTVPWNIAGQSLLAGNVFCGHSGSRLTLTTNGKAYPCKDDPNRIVKRVRYISINRRNVMEERKVLLCSVRAEYAKAAAVIKSLRGESAFSQDLLGSLIADAETKYLEVQHGHGQRCHCRIK